MCLYFVIQRAVTPEGFFKAIILFLEVTILILIFFFDPERYFYLNQFAIETNENMVYEKLKNLHFLGGK